MVLLRLQLLFHFLFVVLCFSFSSLALSSSRFCSSSSSTHSLVCSCSSSSPSSGHLYLSSSSLPDFLHHLVVHSCHRLTIASGTFRGKTVLEHIKLLDIIRLDIRADSFRAMRRSPRLFLLRNAHLPAVPPRAFTGLSRLQHFWWRNISIGRVHQNAFARMAFVDYLYFHTANIKVIDSGAFGHIHRLGHLFFRDGIRIGRMGARVFCGTRVRELVVEQATVKADEATFGGLRASKVRFSDCWWGEAGGERRRKGRRTRRRVREDAVEVGQMLIRNCTMQRLPRLSGALISLFHVQHSTIGRLIKASPHENGVPGTAHAPSAPKMPPSSDSEWHWHSLSNSSSNRMPDLVPTMLNNLSISFPFSHQSSSDIPLLQLIILHCNIRLLPIVAGPSASPSPNFVLPSSSVLFLNSSVLRWVGSPFAVPSPFSSIRHFLIKDSRLWFFPTKAEGPFALLPITDSFQIIRSQMGAQAQNSGDELPPPFGGSKIGTLELVNCQLEQAPDDAFLRSVEVREKLVVGDTQWPCARDICGTEGLFLAQNSHRNLHWQFTSNRCFEPNNSSFLSPSALSSLSSLCESSHPSSSAELVCRRMGPLEECMCRALVPHSSRRLFLFPSSSSTLLLLVGDCPEHSLVLDQSPSFTPIQSLYIFRVRQLIIRSIPPSLRHLNILHTSVSISNLNAFADANLSELAVDGSDLVELMPKGKLNTAGHLGRIRLGTVNNGWREVIGQLTAHEGTDQWKEKISNGGDGTWPEAMTMPRRRGVLQWEEKHWKQKQANSGQGRGKQQAWWLMSVLMVVKTVTVMTRINR